MENYDYLFQHVEDAYEHIENLRTKGRSNILLAEDNKSLSNRRYATSFCIEDGMLHIQSQLGHLISTEELKKIISFFQYTVDNFDEDKSIKKEIESIREWVDYKKKPKKDEPKIVNKGEVYLLKGENGRYKIGCSKNSENRVKTLRLSSCENHILIHKFKCNNPKRKEQELHELFYSKRNHSEWFSLSDSDVDIIKGICDEI